MVNLGIVGAEAAKFTPFTQAAARRIIRSLIRQTGATLVVSGASPLSGIDDWAIEEAIRLGIETREYPPKRQGWLYYRKRNLQIAKASDLVVCITLQQLPDGFTGMRFPDGCYHCGTPPDDHVKSGGCWTAKQAKRLGKRAGVIVIDAPDRVRMRGVVLGHTDASYGYNLGNNRPRERLF